MQPYFAKVTLCRRNLRKTNNMSKVLRVIDPFFVMEIGDTFELSEDGKEYVSHHSEEFHTAKEEGEVNSTYDSVFKISLKWAQQLIEDGYLEEVEETPKNATPFVNVVDEIDRLIDKYQKEANELSNSKELIPECLKVEKTTVLTNLLSVLNYLKSLRK